MSDEKVTLEYALDSLRDLIGKLVVIEATQMNDGHVKNLTEQVTKWKKAANVSENRYKKAMKRVAEVEEEIKLLQSEFFKLKKLVKAKVQK